MASSKAEYLKRYLAKPGDDDGGAKKKKRRKKEHGGHGHSKKPAGMRIFDDDAPAVQGSSVQVLYGVVADERPQLFGAADSDDDDAPAPVQPPPRPTTCG